ADGNVLWLGQPTHAQAPDKASKQSSAAILGGWTLNKDLSDQPGNFDNRGDSAGGDGQDRRGGGAGRRGGFGGGRRGGFGGDGGGAVDQQRLARMRDALRDIMNPPDHLVIADTGSIIVLTAPDGRTLRL